MDSLKAVILGASVVCAQSFSTSIMATPAGIAHTTEVVTAVTTDCPLETGKSAGGDECAKKCNEAYNACRVAPGANQSLCASKLASCVGYNPFTGGAFMSPTACSVGPAAATAPAATSPAGGEVECACAKKCNEEYNACRTAPDANMSLCSSKLASCVGYNPFTGGAFMTPTACSAGPAAATAPAVTAAAGGDAECAKKCNMEYNACRTAPDANMSLCSSNLASCVGYNPFTGGAFMSPTACSAAGQATGAAPTASAGSAGSQGGDAECAKKCNEEYNACRTAPDANMSLCSSKLASCVGYNPFTGGAFMSPTACSAAGQATGTDVSPPAVTAGAGQITPALALLALGAVALL
ncbi:hypothetical protein E4U30_001456 [Claviceps sp. LM220 group G6]|nr:hypothetical protein E4U15_005940 [Claviceps sp. LM218 group G6]KAG6096541.1 hypothetical protein E4U30_001456 [Claviceps sp. LM220 group G6]